LLEEGAHYLFVGGLLERRRLLQGQGKVKKEFKCQGREKASR
jgi:hypothetical protein